MLPLRPALRLSLIAAALVAANLAHAEVPVGAPFTPEQQTALQQLVASQVRATTPAMASAAAAAVEDKTQNIETAKEVLEVGRNQLNFWLAFLGVLTACIGLFGIVVPFFTVRNYKVEIDKQAAELRGMLVQAEAALADVQAAQKNTEAAQQKAEEALKRSEDALQKVETAQQHSEVLQQRVEASQQQAETAQQKAELHAQEIEALVKDARDKTNLIPNADEVTGTLKGEVLETLKQHKPPQVVALIQQAVDKYQQRDWEAAKPLYELLSLVESHESNVWFNLGVVLRNTGADCTKVIACYQSSCLLQPNLKALNNWGLILSDQAKTLTGDKQQQRFTDACDKYAEAHKIGSNDSNIICRFINNWGITLLDWANTLAGEVQQQRFAEACDKFAEATRLDSKDAGYYHNWALTLEDWAETLEGEEREAKLAEAAEHKRKAKELERLAG